MWSAPFSRSAGEGAGAKRRRMRGLQAPSPGPALRDHPLPQAGEGIRGPSRTRRYKRDSVAVTNGEGTMATAIHCPGIHSNPGTHSNKER
jgi:hypothetical protein